MDNTTSQRCRTCLAKSRKMTPISALSKASNNTLHLYDLFMLCAAVQIAPNDGFSQYACSRCIMSAENACLFKKQCEHSDKVWNEFGRRLNNKTTLTPSPKIQQPVNNQHETVDCFTETKLAMAPLLPNFHNENQNFILKIQSPVDHYETDKCLNETITPPLPNFHNENQNFIVKIQLPVDNQYETVECTNETISKPPLSFQDENSKITVKVQIPADNECETFECINETISLPNFSDENAEIIECKLENDPIEIKSVEIYEEVLDSEIYEEANLSRDELARAIEPKKLAVKEFVIYGCRQCSADCKTAEDFVEHCHKLHGGSLENLYYRCKLCARDFADVFAVTVHVSTRHKMKLRTTPSGPKRSTWPQTCKYCELSFKSHREKIAHLSQEHDDLKRVCCDKCGKKFFNSGRLQKHLVIHENIKNHTCEYCGKSFKTSSSLFHHIPIHVGKKQFKCTECGDSFLRVSSLRSHKLNHVTEKNYECKHCHKRYRRAGALRYHMRIHVGGPNYPCHLCPQQLTTSSSLKRHLSIHRNERTYVCKICGKACNRNSNLKIHMRTHTGEKPHVCTICEKGFSQANCLRAHVAKYHKDDIDKS